jgi:hypothetical protein
LLAVHSAERGGGACHNYFAHILRAERHSFQVFETKPLVRPRMSYSNNFAYPRREALMH